MSKSICVYCSSSNHVDHKYFEAARNLGEAIAKRKYQLVYGGANVGLMGEVASAVHENRGKVIGVIPESIHHRGLAFEKADEIIITKDLRERKAIMEIRSDIFITLPGGFGTLEEVLEMITLKQLQYHEKPILFLNIDYFFDPLKELFEHLFQTHFARDVYRMLYHFVDTVDQAFTYIDNYEAPELGNKWQ